MRRDTTRTSRPTPPAAASRVALVAMAAAAAALAASAVTLGQDRVNMQANQQANQRARMGPSGLPPVQNARHSSLAARNAVVTGDVIGNRGFRGSAGYTGTYSFRGDLGSQDIRSFLSISSLTSSGSFRRGSSNARLQYGLALGDIEYRPTGTIAPLQNPALPSARNPGAGGADPSRIIAVSDGTLRDASRVAPLPIGQSVIDGRAVSVGASSVQGITLMGDPGQQRALDSISALDRLYLTEDLLIDDDRLLEGDPGALLRAAGEAAEEAAADPTGQPVALETRVAAEAAARSERMARARGLLDRSSQASTLRNDARVETGTAGPQGSGPQRRGTAAEPIEVEIARRVAERYARLQGEDAAAVDLPPTMLERLDAEMQRIRDLLAPPQTTPATPPGVPPRSGDGEAGDNAIDPDDIIRRPDLSGLGQLLRHGTEVDDLNDGAPDDRVAELVNQAEADLVAGRYFRAERGFRRALVLVSGQPLPFAGLVHAQIGAGLYLPASSALRRLFAVRPEMIGVTWTEDVLPPAERLREVLADTGARLEDDPNAGSMGLVHAYVGRLLERPAAIERGLDAMRAAEPGDPLPDLLAEAWMPEDG